MLSIGEFSNICKVSTKTLRYYAEIGLILPNEINPENGYRYYSIEQLGTMLMINRLKSYHFSLEEIKTILCSEEMREEKLFRELSRKKKELADEIVKAQTTLNQLKEDLATLSQGKSLLSYMEDYDVQLVEVPAMCILSIRKMIQEYAFAEEYPQCFGRLFKRIRDDGLTVPAPPMVLFHSEEYTPLGLDTEFAVPVKEAVTGTRDLSPGLCLKTILYGSYTQLPSVYAKQREWAEQEGYVGTDALYEVYVTDPSQVSDESALVTEIYFPVKKKPLNTLQEV